MPSPASPPPSLKRQILRQAVAENVSTKEGRLPTTSRASASSSHPAKLKRWQLVIAASLTVALSVWGLAAATRDRANPALAPTATQASAGTSLGSSDSSGTLNARISDRTFDAPLPIDPDVFPLSVKRVVIDPGHGGEDTGAVGGGLAEKSMTLDIAHRLRALMQEDGIDVLLTREGDAQVSLRDRANFANGANADLFVSIHINWISTRSVRGLETYFLGATDDPALNALARKENQGSGYSLADMRGLLEQIYTGVRQDESRQLAQQVQYSLFKSLLRQNPHLKDRGVKTAPFVVLVATDMPAILAEVSCLSNEQEAELLARPLYRQHIAEALSRGIGLRRRGQSIASERKLTDER